MKEINPKETSRAAAFALWMKAPNPMVTFFKTFDVMPLVRVSREKGLKFNMLLDYCIGKAASGVKEFYLLPVGEKLCQYEALAVNTIVANSDGEVSSCDVAFTEDLDRFNAEYLRYTQKVRATCADHDLSADHMVIGTSAIVATEIDGAVGMYSGIFNNPFIIWGKYRVEGEKALLPLSFQFHHVQMDEAHAGLFLKRLEEEIARMGHWGREETAIFAGGCFWGVEFYLRRVPGVRCVESGYIGGTEEHPTYAQVKSHATGHAEAVRVQYDPALTSYEELTKRFLEIHDPTQADGQGIDIGPQYRSEIFTLDDSQRETAERLLEELRRRGYAPTTRITPASRFWRAEEYHQNYCEKHHISQPECHVRVKRFG